MLFRSAMREQKQAEIQASLSETGNQRFFAPDDVKTWKEQFKDLEWELDINITGEQKDTQQILTTLNTALTMVMNPGYAQNKQAQMIVGKALELTGALSPLELPPVQSQPQVNQPVGIK